MSIERRFIKGGELRAKQGEKPGIAGISAVYNQQYDTGWMVETIKPGAFNRVLSESPDVRCLFNHDPNNLLGRTKSGTLRLADSSEGLKFECDTDPESRIGADVQRMIDRGDLDGCSFAFRVSKQSWREEKNAAGDWIYYRDIEEIDELLDVGPVTYPAYTGTSVDTRSLWPNGVPAEVRSHVPALADPVKPQQRDAVDGDGDECGCICTQCCSGDCADCTDPDCDDVNCRCQMERSRKREADVRARCAAALAK